MTWKNFTELDAHGQQLFDAAQYDTFIALYESELDHFPQHLPQMIYDLAYVCLIKGNRKRCIGYLSAGLERGYFFALPPWGLFVQQLGQDKKFQKLLAYNQKLQGIARQSAQPQWVVQVPNGFDPFQSYPLLLSLHGYRQNSQTMQRFWHAPCLQESFLHAYLQSSQVVDLQNYGWDDDQIAIQEITQMASEITDHYPVQLDKMLVGGFSQGGTLSIEIALTQALPVCGFIALCPARPDSLRPEALINMREMGLKGVILTGEHDQALPKQQAMVREFEESRLPHLFTIAPDQGHWFPNDLPHQLDLAMQFLLEEKSTTTR